MGKIQNRTRKDVIAIANVPIQLSINSELLPSLVQFLSAEGDGSRFAGNTSDLDLPESVDCARLTDIESIETLVERVKNNMKRKEILANHTPVIKQLPNGRWYTRLNGKKVERVSKKDLEDIVLEFYSNSESTLSTIFENYLERRKKNVEGTTWQKDVLYFETYIKNSPIATTALAQLTLNDGYHFLEHCLTVKPDMKRKYWDNVKGSLNQMFQYAIDEQIIQDNPFRHLKPKKDLFYPETKTRDGDTVFSKAEQSKVVTLAEADANSKKTAEPLGIIMLFNLGMRIGELCALRWVDIEVNHRGKYIHIQREMVADVDENGKAHGFTTLEHCKTPAGDRRLQLNAKVISTLETVKKLNHAKSIPTGPDDYVFMRIVKGELKPCTPRSFDPRLRKYCKQAGMAVIKSPHDVRRTVLTNLYMAHMPLKKIQEFAGHSSLKQTMDYIRITDDDMDLTQYLDTLSEERYDNTVVPFRKPA